MVWNILFGNGNAIHKVLLLAAFVFSAIFAISLHEVAHGFAAYKMGDATAKVQGRLTLNPVAHFDPLGLAMFLLVGFGFAKPVPVNPYNFKNLRKGMLLVSFAGVIANLILALISFGFMIGFGYAGLSKFGFAFTGYYLEGNALYYFLFFLYYFSVFACLLNAVLIAFNLLPIYPLDGFRVVESLAPYDNGYVRFMRRYGQYILIGIVLLGFFFRRVGIPQADIFGQYLSLVQRGILELFELIMGGLF